MKKIVFTVYYDESADKFSITCAIRLLCDLLKANMIDVIPEQETKEVNINQKAMNI